MQQHVKKITNNDQEGVIPSPQGGSTIHCNTPN